MIELTHSAPQGWGLVPQTIPIYTICLLLAFATAFAVYRYNARGMEKQSDQLFPIVLAAYFGGLLGAKLPAVLMNLRYGFDWNALLAGRTIAGGLVGGAIGVLLVKWKLGIRSRHGNQLAAPIALGMAVGRVGCLLSGCCFGKPTTLPWGIDFGDGIARHPTQIYELLFCIGAFILLQRGRQSAPPGRLLTYFFAGYFVFRFFVEFLRPHPVLFGPTIFQWICILGILTLFIKDKLLQAPKEVL